MFTQQEINDGQQKINGALCHVDWYTLKTLEALIKALADKNVLSPTDLEAANLAFTEAKATSSKVAGIEPPGCVPKDPLESPFPLPTSVAANN